MEKILQILSEHVSLLRNRKEYDLIENLYNKLLENKIIHSIEDFKEGKVIKNSAEGTLLYHIYNATIHSWKQTPINLTISEFEELMDKFKTIPEPERNSILNHKNSLICIVEELRKVKKLQSKGNFPEEIIEF